jgi:8-oxo-dGTP pyrophosphatase MutT (NUDIX family)
LRDAVVAVLRRDGRILVIRRGPKAILSGYWAPLSGRVEPGESQETAVVREVREEVGLRARALAKVWECDTDDGQIRLHWWTVEAEPGVLDVDPGEVSEARWIHPDEFVALDPTFAGDRVFFAKVLPTLQ